ncbi:hypothetical protein SGL43_00638 [Streptomyces globisporus]|uniref:DUF2530 domain-containing protein n=1 Tax=Streptomyces globisporus TaxID=1908 RepID=A0ABN8UXV0_STRGL|nr:hypothetical protein GCM10010264_11980 [Streptomyces globisporus]CAH9413639.1 hypothetical protein SGL43_00638 [Streptomyces globisporus]
MDHFRLGSLPPAEVVVDDVRVTHRISALISVFGVFASVLLLALAVREYRSGATVLWLVFGAAAFLGAVYALVVDVRRLRTGPAA